MKESAFSRQFYKRQAAEYAKVSYDYLKIPYKESSNPELKSDIDYLTRFAELVKPGSVGLDIGCGAGARDVRFLFQRGYFVYGIDAVEENIQVTKQLYPELSDWVSVGDIKYPLKFDDHTFDFVICNYVIQHIEPEYVMNVTLKEISRILKKNGVLLFAFKCGSGQLEVFDQDYSLSRIFQLYDHSTIIEKFRDLGLPVMSPEENKLGGVLFFLDRRNVNHCIFFACKQSKD